MRREARTLLKSTRCRIMEKPHKSLDVWKMSMDLVTQIYKGAEKFPKNEKYDLIDQIRRAAASVPSNIAEGAARQTKKEFANYLHISQGSLSELDPQLEIAKRLESIRIKEWVDIDVQMGRIDKMITGLIRHQSPDT